MLICHLAVGCLVPSGTRIIGVHLKVVFRQSLGFIENVCEVFHFYDTYVSSYMLEAA